MLHVTRVTLCKCVCVTIEDGNDPDDGGNPPDTGGASSSGAGGAMPSLVRSCMHVSVLPYTSQSLHHRRWMCCLIVCVYARQ